MATKPVKVRPPVQPADKAVESRYFYSGLAFGLLTMVVFAGLMWMSLNGKSLADQDRLFAIIFLAMGAGLSVGGFGGSATASGQVRIPILDTPFKVASSGGIAVFLIVLFGAFYLLPSPQPEPVPVLSLIQAKGTILKPPPRKLMVTAEFAAFTAQRDRRVVLNLGAGDSCERVKATHTIDEPRLGSYTSFVLAPESDVTCAQLVVHDQNNTRVGASNVVRVQWQ